MSTASGHIHDCLCMAARDLPRDKAMILILLALGEHLALLTAFAEPAFLALLSFWIPDLLS